MLEKPVITLTTDFGLKDSFVRLMKGVILGINPNAIVIDITHDISRHNIFEAAQVISMSYKYFPPTTIHIVVVDPGVGSSRRPILVTTEDHYFIGPDNGVFTAIYDSSHNHFFKVIEINATHYYRQMSGFTFHGRDIFAPIAAHLSKGTESRVFGDQIENLTRISIPKPVISENAVIQGEIVCIDKFGNAISNITPDDMARLAPLEDKNKFKILFNNNEISMVTYYAESQDENLHGIINSFGHLEIFVYRSSVAENFNIKIGDTISVSLA
jgi:S-adenosylmethionine hydrolase